MEKGGKRQGMIWPRNFSIYFTSIWPQPTTSIQPFNNSTNPHFTSVRPYPITFPSFKIICASQSCNQIWSRVHSR
jgi:hypothetical protein